MSNNSGSNTLPSFNNNKSLYGSRSQTNQSSKKISIIEDKTTLEPARGVSSSPAGFSVNSSIHRSVSFNVPTSSELSPAQIRKYIQIQRDALSSFDLDQAHSHIYQELDEWRNSMRNQVDSMKNCTLQENTNSYDQIAKFQTLARDLLEKKVIRQLIIMKTNPKSINTEELDLIEQNLNSIKSEIDFLEQADSQFDIQNAQIIGELQLHKMTDFSKHEPLPEPAASPPPLPLQSFSSVPDRITLPTSPSHIEQKPTPPVWTEATRQGLNNLSRYFPFRLLIPNYVQQELINGHDIEKFNSFLKLSCQSPNECILTVIDQSDIDASIEILADLMDAFKCSSNLYELRVLFHKKHISIITGKRNERLERFREKYRLDLVKVFSQPCPQSDEQVVLIRSQHSEYIIYCLREIIQNVLEQGHFTDDADNSPCYSMYDPSVNYNEKCTNECGIHQSSDNTSNIVCNNNNTNVLVEDFVGSKRQSKVSTSSLSKMASHEEETKVNYDDIDSQSDGSDDGILEEEDDCGIDTGLNASKMPDDTRIYVKKLDCLKERQVELLIDQHITQIQEQTGAKIQLTTDANVPSIIKGTKSQIHQTLRLIKECLQTQKPPLPKTTSKNGKRR